jgi:drug/metabolite transporter (DMT)-like permease
LKGASMGTEGRKKGIYAALSSALFLGMVPIFGKMAINGGFSPLAVIAVRTSIAALLMVGLMYFKMRPFFYIYPVGLLGCLLAGMINGLGSILYYTALSRIDAGVGHMLYSFYPLFLALWLLLDRQPITRLTIFRLALTLPAIFLLILPGNNGVDLLGALMMLGSAFFYAIHMLINQRILYEAPAPTVTLYTLLAMAVTVNIAFLLSVQRFPADSVTWWPVLAMALITFFSRITLFTGIKHLGGLQTALLGLAELIITLVTAQVLLGEQLSTTQWVGAALLSFSLVLVGFDKIIPHKRNSTGWLAWLNPPKISSPDVPWSSRF